MQTAPLSEPATGKQVTAPNHADQIQDIIDGIY